MATAQLNATPRSSSGKGPARTLRSAGQIPGVVYGHARDPQPLTLDTREFEKLLSHIAAESTVIELSLGGHTTKTLIREIQRHPFKRQILHVDFQELVAGEKVTVNIPIVLIGVPDGVRTSGGVLDQTLRELSIHVDPSAIPDHIEVDVTGLIIGHSIHVSELKLAEGIEVMTEAEASVCVVAAPRAVVEETAAATEPAEGGAEPEVIGRGKEAEEETEEK
ncbi:MAG: 50S ribosomal protein L25/general stress protein Ctc [Gemmatimonadaceae bacterium]|nr:50S ribosomal protein L25/general stress protein Ctc [Gemmatimonadaceae bacterium]